MRSAAFDLRRGRRLDRREHRSIARGGSSSGACFGPKSRGLFSFFVGASGSGMCVYEPGDEGLGVYSLGYYARWHLLSVAIQADQRVVVDFKLLQVNFSRKRHTQRQYFL